MHPQLRPFTAQLFLDFCAFFFPEWPLIVFVHDSPSNLAESRYPLDDVKLSTSLLHSVNGRNLYYIIHCIKSTTQTNLAGFLKLKVSFAKEPYRGDYILQERPIIERSLIKSTTHTNLPLEFYGAASISRLLQIICLFCKKAL